MPTPIAIQRAPFTRSPSTNTDSAVIRIGPMKKIEYASASDSVLSPYVNSDSIAMPIAPRSRCSDQRMRSSERWPPRQNR